VFIAAYLYTLPVTAEVEWLHTIYSDHVNESCSEYLDNVILNKRIWVFRAIPLTAEEKIWEYIWECCFTRYCSVQSDTMADDLRGQQHAAGLTTE